MPAKDFYAFYNEAQTLSDRALDNVRAMHEERPFAAPGEVAAAFVRERRLLERCQLTQSDADELKTIGIAV